MSTMITMIIGTMMMDIMIIIKRMMMETIMMIRIKKDDDECHNHDHINDGGHIDDKDNDDNDNGHNDDTYKGISHITGAKTCSRVLSCTLRTSVTTVNITVLHQGSLWTGASCTRWGKG